MSLVVRAPASSANLGAGFDVFGLALDLYVEVGTGEPPADANIADDSSSERNPYHDLGGSATDVWLRTNIPMGRGLGFSGAARVALGGLAVAEQGELDAEGRRAVLATAAAHEQHGDNAAASVYGGFVAYLDPGVVSVPVGPRIAAASFVAWVPGTKTLTASSRSTLPDMVERSAAVHNLSRAVQFTAAIAADEPELLRGAADDRLHQDLRLDTIPGASDALATGVLSGAWVGWLSGSGPTVGFLCDPEAAPSVVAGLGPIADHHGAHTKLLSIDVEGVRVIGDVVDDAEDKSADVDRSRRA